MLRPAPVALKSLVRTLWSQSAAAGIPTAPAEAREQVLPSGCLHLVIRLDGPPLRLIDPDNGRVSEPGSAVVAGIRDRFHRKQAAAGIATVGVQLHAGAARALFGVSAAEIAGQHLPLDALLGSQADRLREQLQAAEGPAQRLDRLASWLIAQRVNTADPHPAVLATLAGLRAGDSIAEVVRSSGFSHRYLAARFLDAVGLTPKRFQRVLRFQRALAMAHARPMRAWADIAHSAGYSDQAHLSREFQAIAGVAPGVWRRAAPRHRHHLPMP